MPQAEDVATSQAQLAEHFAASPLTAPRGAATAAGDEGGQGVDVSIYPLVT